MMSLSTRLAGCITNLYSLSMEIHKQGGKLTYDPVPKIAYIDKLFKDAIKSIPKTTPKKTT